MLRSTLMLIALATPHSAAAADWVAIPAAQFTSVLALEEAETRSAIAAFEVQTRPVTNREFLAFVNAYPDWRRGVAPPIFVDSEYLTHWQAVDAVGEKAGEDAPVTRVSWFAANAYCGAQGGRLPTWLEWEYIAAADETRQDARADPAWRERILGWYSRTGGQTLPVVGKTPANAYGVQDLHGLVWEWVDDFNALMISADSREQGDPDALRFCGAGALSAADRDNYAILMRTAMLSAMSAQATTRNMGFRCVRPPRSNAP